MKKHKILTIVLLLCVGIAIIIAAAAYNVAPWLRAQELPVKSDAIVLLGGSPFRALYAADLYKEGYGLQVYASKPAPEAWEKDVAALGIPLLREDGLYRSILIKKGVPPAHIVFFGPSLSTAQEAEHVRTLFADKQCSVLVVTSPYHVRRTRMIFSDALPSCRVSVVGVPYESFPDHWWSSQEAARNVLLEIAKIFYYKAGGRFRTSEAGEQPKKP